MLTRPPAHADQVGQEGAEEEHAAHRLVSAQLVGDPHEHACRRDDHERKEDSDGNGVPDLVHLGPTVVCLILPHSFIVACPIRRVLEGRAYRKRDGVL